MSNLSKIGDAVPIGYKASIAGGVATGALFIPVYGLVPQTFGTLALAYGVSDTPGNILSAAVAMGLAPFFAGRIALHRQSRPVKRKDRYRGLNIGPVKATERDLFTSMLVLGATGSGKTSRVLFPALEELINTYSDEDDDIFSKNPHQKCGGFVLEVKGKFFETVVTLAHKAGRNSATDVRVIRANSTLPVVEFRDEKDRRFFLNGQPCSTGSEVSMLYKPHKFKDGVAIESTLFKRIRQPDLQHREPELKEIGVKVHEDIRFIGWRWKDGKLHRVRQTLKRNEPEYTGEVVEAPKTLKYFRTLYLSNGLRYNLIDPNIPSSEAAERIAMVAKMVSGEGKGGGDNAFFYQAAGKAIDSAIRLQRIVSPKVQVTVLDVYRIIAHDSAMSAALAKLDSNKTALQQKKIAAEKAQDPDTAYELTKVITSYDDLGKWFTEEWMKLKGQGNTGTSIMATISNLFGPFMRDPNLQETFCQPATFSFNDCMQKGTIFAFVPGTEYEMNARLIGTVLKMDWQSRMLQRVSEGSDALNKNRVILHVADECQAFIISGSQEAGDPKFMSLSRESKVMNICATQSEAWVYSAISHNEARVWTQSFGTRVWLTQTDQDTNKNAAAMCGMIKREKRSHTEEFDIGSLVSGKQQRATQKVGYEEKARFESHEFAELKEDEAVCFNKGEGMLDLHMGNCKAMKGKIPWRWITGDKGVGEIADRMRWWFCETWENDLFNGGRATLLDPIPGQSGNTDTTLPPDAAVSTAVTQTSTTPPAGSGASGGLEQAVKPAGSTPVPSAIAPVVAPIAPVAPDFTDEEVATRAINAAKALPLDPAMDLGSARMIEAGQKPAHDPTSFFKNMDAGKASAPKGEPTAAVVPKSSAVVPSPAPVAIPSAVDAPGQSITPAEIAKQEAAYQELLDTNPFLMVAYEDFAGLDRSRANAKQRTEVPAEDQVMVGPHGVVGGNTALVQEAATAEGSKANIYRAPADLLAADQTAEHVKHLIARVPGTAPAPASVKATSKETRGKWGSW